MWLRIMPFHADMRFMRLGCAHLRVYFPNPHDFYADMRLNIFQIRIVYLDIKTA